jgi:hypothetical protein
MADRVKKNSDLKFRDVVEECIHNIRVQARGGGGLRMTSTLQKYLATHSPREISAEIDGATRPAVRRILCSSTNFTEEE